MDQADRAVGDIGDPAPGSGDGLDGVVIVLGDGMGRDEGIQDQDVDVLVLDFLDNPLDQGLVDERAVSNLDGDRDGVIAPAVGEKPPA